MIKIVCIHYAFPKTHNSQSLKIQIPDREINAESFFSIVYLTDFEQVIVHSVTQSSCRRNLGIIHLVLAQCFANISYSLISTRTCTYQVVTKVSSSDNFAYILNEWSFRKYSQELFLVSMWNIRFWDDCFCTRFLNMSWESCFQEII